MVSLVALVVMLPSMVTRLMGSLKTDLTLVLGNAGDVRDLEPTRAIAQRVLTDSVQAVAPAVAVVGLAALLSGCVVTRSKPNPAMLRPHFERLHPGKTIKHLLGPQGLFMLVKDTLKLLGVALLTWGAWEAGAKQLVSSGGTFQALQTAVGDSVRDMLWRIAVLALVVGFADAAWQRRTFNKQARMSKQDVADEHKQAEGDPHLKGQIRGRMLAAARNRQIQAVPKADVVLANPTHLVVALAYQPGSAAPVVVAKGAGAMAQRIKDVAAEHGVPVLADKPLARAIYKSTEVGDGIPLELFRAVAEVLAVVYAAKRRGTRPTWRSRMAGATA